jgi:hypothetical protein
VQDATTPHPEEEAARNIAQSGHYACGMGASHSDLTRTMRLLPLLVAGLTAVTVWGCTRSNEGFDAKAACEYLSQQTLTSTPIGEDGKPDQPDRLVKFYGKGG